MRKPRILQFLAMYLTLGIAWIGLPMILQAQTLPPPVLISPIKDSIIQFPGAGADVFFAWEPVVGAGEYMINVAVNSIPKAPIRTVETSLYLNLNLQAKDSTATVSWSVLSVSGTLTSSPAVSRFTFAANGTPIPTPVLTITPTPLPPPILYIPIDRENFSALDQVVLFDWSDVTGASSYSLTVYKDNEVYLNRVVKNSSTIEQFQQQIYSVLQWDVRSVNSLGTLSERGYRRSFSVGGDYLPTPTPMPPSADIDQNGILDIHDLYHFAQRYATNDPITDLDHSGLNTQSDLLRFLELFIEKHP